MLYQVLIIIHLIVALCLIGLVLIQQGKGADMGASFGAGSSATLFGSSGSGNFLTKATKWLAIAFFAISLVLGNLTANREKGTDDLIDLAVSEEVVEVVDAIPGEEVAVEEVIVDTIPADNADVPAADDMPSDTSAKESDVPE